MIKLISQFDNEKSKLSLATPTCGCCCCCCCLISTIAVSSISARNFGRFIDQDDEKKDTKKRYPLFAMSFGFFAPIVGVLLGLMLYLIFEELSYIETGYFYYNYIYYAIGCLAYFVVMIKVLNKKGNKLKGLIGRIIGYSIILAVTVVAEIFGAAWLIFSVELGFVYLTVAIIIDIFLLINMCKPKNDLIKTNVNVDNQNMEKDKPVKSENKCLKCGKVNTPGSRFCVSCYKPLHNSKKIEESKGENEENI